MSQIKRKKIYLGYTFAFLIVAAVVFSQFIFYGKTIIEYHDSLQQYYAGFQYFVSYVHDVIRTFLSTGHLDLPMWEFQIGMGGDVLTALNYYVIGDPINLIGIFFKSSQLPVVYQLLIIFRLYLAGIAFIAFCRKINYGKPYVILGAIMYSFSVFALYSAVMYAAFPNILIYLPLLLIAVERVFKKEGWGMLTATVTLCLISNFYFCYMLAIIVAIYCILRYIFINREILLSENDKLSLKKQLADLFSWIIKIAVPVVMGALISCIILVPDLMVFANQGRGAGQVVKSYVHYNVKEYMELLSSMFSPKIASNFNLLGFCPLVLITVLLLFQKNENNKRIKKILRASFVICIIFLMFPIFGYALNGFAYINNRWLFGMVFLASVTVVVMFEELFELTQKNQLIILGGVAIYFMIYLVTRAIKIQSTTVSFAWCFFLLALVLVLNNTDFKKTLKYLTLSVVGMACVAAYGFNLYNPIDSSIMSTKVDITEMKNLKKNRIAGAATKIDDDSFYRVDVVDEGTLNEGLLFGFNGVSFYYSLYEGNITDFNSQLRNSGMTVPNLSHGNNGRTYLDALCNVKYAIGSGQWEVPYGYEKYKSYTYENGEKKYIYKNTLTTPFAYVTKDYISEDKYESYSVLQKEQAMMEVPVINEENAESLNEITPEFSDEKLDYKVKATEGTKIKNDKIIVTKRDGIVTFEVDIPEGREVFIEGCGLEFKAYNPEDNPEYYYSKNASKYENRKNDYLYSKWNFPTALNIKASMKKRNDSVSIYLENYKYYWNQKDFILCLGSTYSGKQEIILKLSEPGEYKFSEINILTESMDKLEEQIANQNANGVKDVQIETNLIKGTATTEGKSIAVFSVPYSNGWTAKVDGKPAKIIKTNIMWSGVYLEDAGEHQIVLQYTTPGLAVGAVITAAALLVLAVIFLGEKFVRIGKNSRA